MKRAWVIFAAALLVLLSYPLTNSHAGQLDSTKPQIVSPPDTGVPDSRSGDSGGDDGDADDIGSYKLRGDANLGGAKAAADGGFRIFLRVWLSFMALIR